MPMFGQDFLNNDQMAEQIQVLREEHEIFVAEVKSELDATIASTRATARASIQRVTDAAKQRIATLERELAEVRAKLSRYEMLDAVREAQ